MNQTTLLLGDCLEKLKELPDNSIDSIVTDPPYGLGKEPDAIEMLKDWLEAGHHEVKGKGFMGKEWDAFVPQPQVWRECLRVLKPGGHLLAFAGTRTQDLMCLGLRLAGFEIRDMVAWVYGCLSEDTELLIDGKWEPYHKAIYKGRALCYNATHDTFKWESIQELVEYDYDDTAYRIQGDYTDQIVSRNHRCLVERDGSYSFALAETLERQARVPVLESVQDLLDAIPVPNEGAGRTEQVLQSGLCSEAETEGSAFIGAKREGSCLRDLRQGDMETGSVAAENQNTVLFTGVQRKGEGRRVGEARAQGAGGVDGEQRGITPSQDDRSGKSSMEGRCDLFEEERKLQTDQICQMPSGLSTDGEEGWVRHGASLGSSESDRAMLEARGSSASCEPRSAGQQIGESGAFCEQQRPQTVRASRFTCSDLATVTPMHYKGKVWCIRVPSGAFVARRNGKVFVTGNSGFPKSLDVSKALDKMAGTEREVVGERSWSNAKMDAGNGVSGLRQVGGFAGDYETERINVPITAPATEAAKQWDGWGTALKPALEPITLARKPLEGTVAANVLKWHTGGLNIDACRVEHNENLAVERDTKELDTREQGWGFKAVSRGNQGRFPANLIHDGSDEVVALFPDSKGQQGDLVGHNKNRESPHGCFGRMAPANDYIARKDSGSAARFFYAAKCSKKDRNDGCDELDNSFMAASNQDQAQLKRGITEHQGDSGTNSIKSAKNNHPTVKPTDLMRYLCRLITPSGGTILDPYMGSGSTGKAAMREGNFSFIGIERDPDYFRIAETRINAAKAALATKPVPQPDLFEATETPSHSLD